MKTHHWLTYHKRLVVEISQCEDAGYVFTTDVPLLEAVRNIVSQIEHKTIVIRKCMVVKVGFTWNGITVYNQFVAYSDAGTEFDYEDADGLAANIVIDMMREVKRNDKQYMERLDGILNDLLSMVNGDK